MLFATAFPHPLAFQGDYLCKAAHGLTTGFVHSSSSGSANGGAAQLDGVGALLGLSAAEVDDVERRMLRVLGGSLMDGDGEGSNGLAEGIHVMSEVERSLEHRRLQASTGHPSCAGLCACNLRA